MCIWAKGVGYIISAAGVSKDQSKVEGMLNWPVPPTLQELRAFLGLTGYYRRFLKGYGGVSQPLTDLFKKDAFHWGEEAEAAFQRLKKGGWSLPYQIGTFVLETDASGRGIGAVLMQLGRPIAYLSKALGPKSLGLSTSEKEFLALLLAISKWKHYLQGSQFLIRTDSSIC
jgi:hypothetical protein